MFFVEMSIITDLLRAEIEKALRDKGMSKADLADMLGKSRQDVSGILKPEGSLSNNKAEEILGLLGVKIQDLNTEQIEPIGASQE